MQQVAPLLRLHQGAVLTQVPLLMHPKKRLPMLWVVEEASFESTEASHPEQHTHLL